ncbi:MAG: hypothetical protein AAGA61_02510 [Pseudomonadota bacterium]
MEGLITTVSGLALVVSAGLVYRHKFLAAAITAAIAMLAMFVSGPGFSGIFLWLTLAGPAAVIAALLASLGQPPTDKRAS